MEILLFGVGCLAFSAWLASEVYIDFRVLCRNMALVSEREARLLCANVASHYARTSMPERVGR